MNRFLVGDIVKHRHSTIRGEIIEVNIFWGWYKVKWDDGFIRMYGDHMRKHEKVIRFVSRT